MTYLVMITKRPTDMYYFIHSPNFPLRMKHKDAERGLEIYTLWLPVLRETWIEHHNTLPPDIKETVSYRVNAMINKEINLEPSDFVNYTNYHIISV